jgi:alpha-aminoadipic semialdehyde synthase
MCKFLGLQSDTIFYDNLLELITERCGSSTRTNALAQLGLLSDEKVWRLGSPLDTISHHLASIMGYESDERDLVLMRHEVNK